MADFGKVAVLMGGRSGEREISLMTGSNVLEALQRKGIDAHRFDPAERSIFELVRDGVGRAFIALHGRYGEDGTVQGALELMEIPYTGSGVMASALCLDKLRTKLIWQASGIPTPRGEVITATTDWTALAERLGLPLVIAEEFITGRELTAAFLGDRALPLVRIEAPAGNYDYQNKYFNDDTKYHCPSGLPAAEETAIQALVMRAVEALGCAGWGRADLILRDDGKPFLLEMNTIPGMTGHSLVPMAARAAGIAFDDLALRILELAHVG